MRPGRRLGVPAKPVGFVGWEMARGKGAPRSGDATGSIRGPHEACFVGWIRGPQEACFVGWIRGPQEACFVE